MLSAGNCSLCFSGLYPICACSPTFNCLVGCWTMTRGPQSQCTSIVSKEMIYHHCGDQQQVQPCLSEDSSLQSPNLKCCCGALVLGAFPLRLSLRTSGLSRSRDAPSSLQPQSGAPSQLRRVQPSACQPLGFWVSTQRLCCRVWFFSSYPLTQSDSGYRGLTKESFCLCFKVPCFFTAVCQPGRGITFQLGRWSMYAKCKKEGR